MNPQNKSIRHLKYQPASCREIQEFERTYQSITRPIEDLAWDLYHDGKRWVLIQPGSQYAFYSDASYRFRKVPGKITTDIEAILQTDAGCYVDDWTSQRSAAWEFFGGYIEEEEHEENEPREDPRMGGMSAWGAS